MGQQEVLNHLEKNKVWQGSEAIALDIGSTRCGASIALRKLHKQKYIDRRRVVTDHHWKYVWRIK